MARTADAEGHQGEESAKALASAHRHRGKTHPRVAGGNYAAGGEVPAASALREAPATTVDGVKSPPATTTTAPTEATKRLQPDRHARDRATVDASIRGQASPGHPQATTADQPATETTKTPALFSQTTTAATLRTDSSSSKLATAASTRNATTSTSAAASLGKPAASPHDPTATPLDPAAGRSRLAAETNSLPGNASRSIIDGHEAPASSLSARLTSLGHSQSAGSGDTAIGTGATSAATTRSNPRLARLSAAMSSLPHASRATATTAGQGTADAGRVAKPARATTESSATRTSAVESSATGANATGAALPTQPTTSAQSALRIQSHRTDRIGLVSSSGNAPHQAAANGTATVTDPAATANVGPSSLTSAATAGGRADGQAGAQPVGLASTGGEPAALAYASGMRETIETLNATVALARRQGAAQATITLEPAELGAVRIHLSQSSEGLIARVSAETAAGAQAIASGHRELHSTLSSLGIALLRLDVGAFSDQQGRAGGHAQRPTEARQGKSLADENDLEELRPATPTTTVALSSSSALIDVLA